MAARLAGILLASGVTPERAADLAEGIDKPGVARLHQLRRRDERTRLMSLTLRAMRHLEAAEACYEPLFVRLEQRPAHRSLRVVSLDRNVTRYDLRRLLAEQTANGPALPGRLEGRLQALIGASARLSLPGMPRD